MDNKLHLIQQQQQQQEQQQQTKSTPWRWREKEMEMQTLQSRLTEREREIGRLKEKLRDLTKKLQQEQQYNSKVRYYVGNEYPISLSRHSLVILRSGLH